MSNLDTKQEVIQEILGYFVRNPQAADSLEGIAKWRLLDEIIYRKVDETRMALNWLVKRGFLLETTSLSAGAIFSLNPEQIAEAQKLLAEAKSSPS